MHMKPIKKQNRVISLFSSKTFTASLAEDNPFRPLKNFPGPKTEQIDELRMAHNSSPIAQAVIDRYVICSKYGVESLNCIFREPNANPAIIAAIDEIPLYRATK